MGAKKTNSLLLSVTGNDTIWLVDAYLSGYAVPSVLVAPGVFLYSYNVKDPVFLRGLTDKNNNN